MATRPGPTAHRPEGHRAHRSGWLRAAVLGADDGIVSTASLMIGIVAAHGGRSAVLTAGLAGLAAGAMAMAAGEYVSVAAQRDTERADLVREREELAASPEMELRELALIYERRGLAPELASEVARQLSAHDALAAHARDELGLTVGPGARPLEAAAASALAFVTGAILPIIALLLAPPAARTVAIVATALAGLAALGTLGALAGGAGWGRATARVVAGGSLAMVVTAGVGLLTHTAGA